MKKEKWAKKRRKRKWKKRRKKKIFFFLRVKSKIKFFFFFFLFGYLSYTYLKYKRWWWGLCQGGRCHPLFCTLQQSQIQWGAMRWDELSESGENDDVIFHEIFPFLSFSLPHKEENWIINYLVAEMLGCCGVVCWWCRGWGWYIGVVGRFLFSFLPLFCWVQFLS